MLIWNATTQKAMITDDDYVVITPVFAEAQGNNFMVYVDFSTEERFKEFLTDLNAAIRDRHKIVFDRIVEDAHNCLVPLYEIWQSSWNSAARACEFEVVLVRRGVYELQNVDGGVAATTVVTLFDKSGRDVLLHKRVGYVSVKNIIEEHHRAENGWRVVFTIETVDEQSAKQLVADAKQLRVGCIARVDYRSGLYEVIDVSQKQNRIDITLFLKRGGV